MHSLQRSFFSCSDNSDMKKFFLVQSQNVLPYSFYPFVSVSDTTLLHIVATEITEDRHSFPPSVSHRFPLPPVYLTILLRTYNNCPHPDWKGSPTSEQTAAGTTWQMPREGRCHSFCPANVCLLMQPNIALPFQLPHHTAMETMPFFYAWLLPGLYDV